MTKLPDPYYTMRVLSKPTFTLERCLTKLDRVLPETQFAFELAKWDEDNTLLLKSAIRISGDTPNAYSFLFESYAVAEMPNEGKKPSLPLIKGIAEDLMVRLNDQFQSHENFKVLNIPKQAVRLSMDIVDALKLQIHHLEL